MSPHESAELIVFMLMGVTPLILSIVLLIVAIKEYRDRNDP